MTEMKRLAAMIADGDVVEADRLHGCMRRWGFRGFTVGFQPFLALQIALAPELLQLSRQFPGLAAECRSRMEGARLKAALVHYYAQRSKSLSGEPNNLDQLSLLHSEFDCRRPAILALGDVEDERTSARGFYEALDVPFGYGNPVMETRGARLLIAAANVLKSIWNGSAERLNGETLPALPVIEALFRNESQVPFWRALDREIGSDQVELPDLLAAVQAVSDQDYPDRDDFCPRSLSERELLSFRRLLENTCAGVGDEWPDVGQDAVRMRRDASPTPQSPDVEVDDHDDHVRRWGNRNSTELSDRELLIESSYGLSISECALVGQGSSGLSGFGPAVSRRDEVVVAASQLFLALALATARIPSAVGRIRVLPESTVFGQVSEASQQGGDCLVLRSRGRGEDVDLFWQVPRFGETGLTLHLEEWQGAFPSVCRDFCVEELLARVTGDIGHSVDTHVAQILGRSEGQMRLCIKHALAREMFSFNANRAVIEHVLAPPDGGKKRIEPTSLGKYIGPHEKCVLDAFQFAARRLRRGRHDEDWMLAKPVSPSQACTVVPCALMSSLVHSLKALASHPAADMQSPQDRRKHHNSFAIYCAGMVDDSIGTRPSKSTAYFPHDLNRAERTIFVAEKIAVGREARFLPMVDLVKAQHGEYLSHVLWMAHETRVVNPALADMMLEAIGVIRSTTEAGQRVGMYFIITAHGSLRTIQTSTVDAKLHSVRDRDAHLSRKKVDTRARRRNLATYLANRGLSGMIVEAFLGHADRLHPYGESSCWIPREVLSRIAPLVSDYLAVNGWTVINAAWTRGFKSKHRQRVPHFHTSKQGYDGRQLDGYEALHRAKSAVKSVIDVDQLELDRELELDRLTIRRIERAIKAGSEREDHVTATLKAWENVLASSHVSDRYFVPRSFLTARPDEGGMLDRELIATRDAVRRALREILPSECAAGADVEFDDGRVQAIRDAAETLLKGDRRAISKLREAIAGVVGAFRRKPGYLITAASLNLTRLDVGPVPVTAGRHLAIATHVVDSIPGALRDYLEAARKDRSTEPLKRIAGVVVLLVVSNAVLNIDELGAIIEAVETDKLLEFESRLHVRATVKNFRAVYDRTVDCTYDLAAALVGYDCAKSVDADTSFEDISREADRLVQRIVGRDIALDLKQLIEVMKPYWFLRLPGATYAHCAGQVECNAPSIGSMRLLLGGKPTALTLPKKLKSIAWSEEEVSDIAVAEVGAMMKPVKGKIENGHSASRTQRMRLRRALNGDLSPVLIELMCSFQVVDLWVNFLRYMLEVGGIRVRHYAFNSIVTYQGRILKALLKSAWNLDVVTLNAAGFDELYSQVLQKITPTVRSDAKTVLRLFHAFLRSWFGAGKCSVLPAAPRRKRMARNVVLPDRCVIAALESLPVTGAAARILAIEHAYGTRTEEGYGALGRDFVDKRTRALRIRRNAIRSVKTFERTVPISRADALSEHIVKKARARTSANSDSAKDPVFASQTESGSLVPFNETVGEAILALKSASGEATAVLYSLRHTFADAISFRILIDAPHASPIAVALAKGLSVSPATALELKNCHPNKTAFPAQMDRLGMWLGQAGTSTLLTTYFHSSWSVAGEYCARNALSMEWNPGELAALLGVSRSRVAQLQANLPKDKGLQGQLAGVVEAFVKRGGFPKLVDVAQESSEISVAQPPRLDFALPVADAVLVMCRRTSGDRAALAREIAQDFLVSEPMLQRFLEGYVVAANSAKFVDFEPNENRSGRAARVGVDRGHARRQQILAIIEAKASEQPAFATESATIALEWLESVSGLEPLIVSRSLTALKRHVHWLKRLGYKDSQLVVRNYRGDLQGIREALGDQVMVEASSKALGRLGMIGLDAEFGLTVTTTERLPCDRDLQRVIFCLACCVKGRVALVQES